MKRFVLILMSLLTLVLSACGTTEAPVAEAKEVEPTQLEIALPEIEQPGCSLPVLYLSEDAEPSEILQDCVSFSWDWICKRPGAKVL